MTEISKGALAGLRVIDLTRVLGGPYCTQILGDHGAEIIKIEPPQGDETRDWGPPFEDGVSSYYAGINRNKRGVALDLSRGEGREVLLRLGCSLRCRPASGRPGWRVMSFPEQHSRCRAHPAPPRGTWR